MPSRNPANVNNLEGDLDVIRAGKGDDIINPIKIDFDDENKPINISNEVIFNSGDPETVDTSATLGSTITHALRNNAPVWDGGEGDDIINASHINFFGATYLGGNGDDKLYSNRSPLGAATQQRYLG